MIHEQLVLTNRTSRGLVEIQRTAVSLAVALLALNILDIALTTLVIEHFGAVEVNPVMAPIIGTPLATMLKVGIPMAAIALASQVRTQLAVNALRIAVALYLCVTVSLLGQLALVLI